MKAIWVRKAGGPEVLKLAETDAPAPRDGEVRIKVSAIGVNYADVMCRKAIHQSMRPPPIIVGCEAAGVIDACGTGVPNDRMGERVGVYSPFGGAYAEWLTVPQAYALPIPAAMSFEEAAAFTHVFLTAHFALSGGDAPAEGATVLITAAAGGLGEALLQLAQSRGLKPLAAVGSEAKQRELLDRGVRPVLNYRAGSLTDQVMEATAHRGIDLAIETVGGEIFDQALAALAPLGRITIAGMASGIDSRPNMAALLARSATCATLNLSVIYANKPRLVHDAWARLIAAYLAGTLRPRIARRFALSEAADAHRLIESRGATGKILLDPNA